MSLNAIGRSTTWPTAYSLNTLTTLTFAIVQTIYTIRCEARRNRHAGRDNGPAETYDLTTSRVTRALGSGAAQICTLSGRTTDRDWDAYAAQTIEFAGAALARSAKSNWNRITNSPCLLSHLPKNTRLATAVSARATQPQTLIAT